MFFALKGENFNGNTFAKKALENGAKYVIIDEKENQVSRVDYNLNWAVQDIMILKNEAVQNSIENYS